MSEEMNSNQVPEEENQEQFNPIYPDASVTMPPFYEDDEDDDEDEDEDDYDEDDCCDEEEVENVNDGDIEIIDPDGFIRLLSNVIQALKENNGVVSRAALADIVSQCLDSSDAPIEIEIAVPEEKIKAAQEEAKGKTMLAHLETLANDFGMSLYMIDSDEDGPDRGVNGDPIHIHAITDPEMVGEFYNLIKDVNKRIDFVLNRVESMDMRFNELKQHVSTVSGSVTDSLIESTNEIVTAGAKNVKKWIRKSEDRQMDMIGKLTKAVSKMAKHMNVLAQMCPPPSMPTLASKFFNIKKR